MFSTDNCFKISVSILLLSQNMHLLVERVSLCSLQILALKSVCRFRHCDKICPCSLIIHCKLPCFQGVINSIPLALGGISNNSLSAAFYIFHAQEYFSSSMPQKLSRLKNISNVILNSNRFLCISL